MDSTPAPGASLPCPVCGDRSSTEIWRLGDRIFETTRKLFPLHRCGSCDTDYLNPVPAEQELEAYYPTQYWVAPKSQTKPSLMARLTEFYRRQVLWNHVGFVRRVIDEQTRRGLTPRIIDVGCGDGSYLDALGFEHSTGMDLSISALRAGRARGLTTVRGTLFAKRQPCAPFTDQSFSLIASFHFLEHIADPRPALVEIRRLLTRDGDLVIQVPNKNSWQAKIFGARWSGLDVPRHLVDYSARTLCTVLKECGFDVIRQSHFSLRDGPTMLALSLVPKLYPLGRQVRMADRDVGLGAWCTRIAFLMVTLACVPLALLESMFGRGGAVMVQARPRGQ